MKISNLIITISFFAVSINAQDITNKLGGNTAAETYDVTDSADNLLFRVQGDGGALFSGTWGTGIIPVTGAGLRMIWFPNKAAFRVGYVDGVQWDNSNIGTYSIAMGKGTIANATASTALGSETTASASTATSMGYKTIASGAISTAMGDETTASGSASTAMGNETTASGDYSAAMGSNTIASATTSTALGSQTTASGNYSIAMGVGSTSSGFISTAMGYNTTASGSYSTAIGEGITASGSHSVAIALSNQSGADVTQANTMAIMGGNIGIGTVAPNATLDVHGTVKVFGDWDNSSYQPETIYQAPTDGMVMANFQFMNGAAIIHGITDSNIAPSTIRVRKDRIFYAGEIVTWESITFAVKKDDYWKVTDTLNGTLTINPTINWIPLGQ